MAVVFSDKHSPESTAAFAHRRADVAVYVVHKDGLVETVNGPSAQSLPAIDAAHVVWVGVPNRWAMDHVGTTSLHLNHHVGGRTRFSQVRETVLIDRAVDQAFEAIARDADRKETEAKTAVDEAIAARRSQRLGSKPPWYIPEGLR